jgi:hypothetical protein
MQELPLELIDPESSNKEITRNIKTKKLYVNVNKFISDKAWMQIFWNMILGIFLSTLALINAIAFMESLSLCIVSLCIVLLSYDIYVKAFDYSYPLLIKKKENSFLKGNKRTSKLYAKYMIFLIVLSFSIFLGVLIFFFYHFTGTLAFPHFLYFFNDIYYLNIKLLNSLTGINDTFNNQTLSNIFGIWLTEDLFQVQNQQLTQLNNYNVRTTVYISSISYLTILSFELIVMILLVYCYGCNRKKYKIEGAKLEKFYLFEIINVLLSKDGKELKKEMERDGWEIELCLK